MRVVLYVILVIQNMDFYIHISKISIIAKYMKYRINHLLHSSWNMAMLYHSKAVFALAFSSNADLPEQFCEQ